MNNATDKKLNDYFNVNNIQIFIKQCLIKMGEGMIQQHHERPEAKRASC